MTATVREVPKPYLFIIPRMSKELKKSVGENTHR
jgi:hypothetical protein